MTSLRAEIPHSDISFLPRMTYEELLNYALKLELENRSLKEDLDREKAQKQDSLLFDDYSEGIIVKSNGRSAVEFASKVYELSEQLSSLSTSFLASNNQRKSSLVIGANRKNSSTGLSLSFGSSSNSGNVSIGVNSGGLSSNSTVNSHNRTTISENPTANSLNNFMRFSSNEALFGGSREPISRSPAISIPSTSSLLQSARTSGQTSEDSLLIRKQPMSRSLEDSAIFHHQTDSISISTSMPYNTPLKIPRSPAIPISSGKLRANAPEFRAPASSSSDASFSPPTSSSTSPPDSRKNLSYASSHVIHELKAFSYADNSSPANVDLKQILNSAHLVPPSSFLGNMTCFLLCDVSREVSLESMRRCVQEKFDLPMSDRSASLGETKEREDVVEDDVDQNGDPKTLIEFGEGGPGAGRVAFVFVAERHAHKLYNVKRFRAVVDGIKMRMKVTHVPMSLVEQYR